MTATDRRLRCRCCDGTCSCTRSGRPAAVPPVLTAAGRSTSDPYGAVWLVAQRRAYRVFADASNTAVPDSAALELVQVHASLSTAGRRGDAAAILVALRLHGAHRRDMAARAALDALEVRVFGTQGALVRRIERRQRAQADRAAKQLDDLYARVRGPERLGLLQLRRRVAAVVGRAA